MSSRRESVSPLDQYRELAARHYESIRYRRDLDAIDKAVASMRDRVIALDVEGTILSLSLLRQDGDPRWAREAGVNTGDRLRRPHANELIEILSASKNEIKLWTGAGRDRINVRLQSAGIHLPKGVELITRAETQARFCKMLIKEEVAARDPIPMATIPEFVGATEKVPKEVTNLTRFDMGMVKIPRLFGVDALIDDYAEIDREVCRAIYGDEEAAKIVDIAAFAPQSTGELGIHFADRELKRVIQQLASKQPSNSYPHP